MVQSFESRQNDVAETSNGLRPGLKSLYKKLKNVMDRNNQVDQKKNQDEKKENRDYDHVDYEVTANPETVKAVNTLRNKIMYLNNIDWKSTLKQSCSFGTYSRQKGNDSTYLGESFLYGDETWYVLETPLVVLDFICENYDVSTFSHCDGKIKDPETWQEYLYENLNYDTFDELVKTMNAELDYMIQQAETEKQRVMKRIAGQKIAQNNEEYHKEEGRKADADLKSQLSNID